MKLVPFKIWRYSWNRIQQTFWKHSPSTFSSYC